MLIIVNGRKDVLKNINNVRGEQSVNNVKGEQNVNNAREENKCGKTSASRLRVEGTLSAHQPETIAEEVLYVLKKSNK